MISNVIIHLLNDLPIVADIEALPAGGDRSVRCTNVRTVDGKRPSFVHDQQSTFIFPLGAIRLIEAPADGTAPETPTPEAVVQPVAAPQPMPDEEPDEDLVARIRQA